MPEIIDSETYWLHDSFSGIKQNRSTVFMLPAYDEFIISYKNRRTSPPLENHHKAVSDNGILRPVIVINGAVAGIWRRTIKDDKIIVDTDFFQPYKKSSKNLIEIVAVTFGHFLDKKIEIKLH